MSRVKAVELVAHGVKCDGLGCEILIPVRNEQSKPPGYYIIKVERVTEYGNRYENKEELFYHGKECMLDALSGFSSIATEPLGKA